MEQTPFESGSFFIGCNYWASHAGMFMWRNWDPAVVEEDFRLLAEYGVTTLRVFPLWSDFQPLTQHRAWAGTRRELRLGEKPLPFTEAGQAGVDEEMLGRFGAFCALAEKHGLRLIVGLLTGWMSGRLFAPPALEQLNLITDPLALEWELRFVRVFVRRFRGEKAILAWDLGNECNCLGQAGSPQAAYLWTAAVSMAIRVEDPGRRVLSGMHSLTPEGEWRIRDQGELTDVLTTHPYPLFTPHCGTDPLNRMKSALHAATESRLYADLGKKPCFAEEIGVLGPMMVADELAADYVRAAMLSLLGQDCGGFQWWCAFEQSMLSEAPYDWNGVERELGLFRADRSPKPVALELRRFGEFVRALPLDRLPKRTADALCVLTRGNDAWATAYGTALLAKQAGIDVDFAWCEDELPRAERYLLPNLRGDSPLNRGAQLELLRRVREEGATLYLSLEGALLSPFSEFSGVRVLWRQQCPQRTELLLDGRPIPVSSGFRLRLESVGAEILARTSEGEIALTRAKYGAGTVVCCFFPVESMAAELPGVLDGENAAELWRVFAAAGLRCEGRIARIEDPTAGLTEHPESERCRWLLAVNYEPEARTLPLRLAPGWRVTRIDSPDGLAALREGELSLGRNSGALLKAEKA